MKKQRILLTVLLALGCISVMAMTDAQVMQNVAKLYKKGMNNTEIAQNLLAQGATMEQLQRLQKQYSTLSADHNENEVGKSNVSGLRSDNGEKRDSVAAQTNRQPKPAAAESRPKVYGHDMFRRPNAAYTAQMNQATPKNYILGAGDQVIIDIYGASQEQWQLEITPDGNITIPDYGPVQLSGLTVADAVRRLKSTVGTRYQNSQLMMSVGQTRTITIHVMGEVETPGSFQLSAFATPLNALSVAGGVTEMGTLRAIRVYRNNKPVYTVDLYQYLMQGKSAAQERLEDGDMIIVGAYEQLVSVAGKIKRPMYYELSKGETIDRLLQYAGGFSGDAYTAGVRVARRNGQMGVHTVLNEQFESFALMDGDEVYIDAVLNRLTNTVEIAGDVFRPGQYGYSDNLHTLRQLVEMAGGITETAFTHRIILYRLKPDRSRQAISIDLEGILNGTVADVELKNEDQVYIPTQAEKLNREYVIIRGEVLRPDTFYYAENESVEDLILRAGGLTERASMNKVDVARRIIDPKADKENAIKCDIYTIRLQDNMAVGEHGFLLEPFDEVYVRVSPGYGTQANVSVRGEILYGGTYAMNTQDDRLSDLVKRAGGLSSHAYAAGARLQRCMTEEERIRRDQLLKMNENASHTEAIDVKKLDVGDTYYVGIDLMAAIENPGGNEDIVLRAGDVLMIPAQNTTVKINGEVCYPNTVSYIQGKRAGYYVRQAGGYSNRARRCKTYIIYANGKVGTRLSKVQPGSEVVVPSRPERHGADAAQWVGISGAAASLASVVATVTTVVLNATK